MSSTTDGSLAAFLAMGGYAFFVWSSYGITVLILALNVLLPLFHGRAVRRRLRRSVLAAAHDPSSVTREQPEP